MRTTFLLNGQEVTVEAPGMMRLLDVLREKLAHTGSKEGCGEGECGACSVLLNGKLVMSCLVPVAQCADSQVITIEAVANNPVGKAVQSAFVKCGGAQCGICTPGMVMASIELLSRNPSPTDDEIKAGLAGNLCRCTGYFKIFDSVRSASRVLSGREPPCL